MSFNDFNLENVSKVLIDFGDYYIYGLNQGRHTDTDGEFPEDTFYLGMSFIYKIINDKGIPRYVRGLYMIFCLILAEIFQRHDAYHEFYDYFLKYIAKEFSDNLTKKIPYRKYVDYFADPLNLFMLFAYEGDGEESLIEAMGTDAENDRYIKSKKRGSTGANFRYVHEKRVQELRKIVGDIITYVIPQKYIPVKSKTFIKPKWKN